MFFPPTRILPRPLPLSLPHTHARRHFTTIADRLRTLVSRQIDIQPNRALRTIAERKCVLAALQRFGEVATFLLIKDDPNSRILAIFDTPEAANKAILASPLTIPLFPPGHELPRYTDSASTSSDNGSNNNNRKPEQNSSLTISCKIGSSTKTRTKTEHERIVRNNKNNNTRYHDDNVGYLGDIGNDPRVADVIAADVPRWEFVDILGDNNNSFLASDQTGGHVDDDGRELERETIYKDKDKDKNRRQKRQEKLIAKGSLMALVDK